MVNQQQQAHLKRQKKGNLLDFCMYKHTPQIASPVLLALNFSQ